LGAVQRVALKQREARPVVVEVWTRCEGTEFPPSSEYSLYCDLTYADGTREFGVLTKCPTDARAWERVELVLQPTRAIAAIDLYCLFRNTAGTAWFDDVACREVDPARVRMFDGEIVRQVAMPTRLVTTQPSWMDDLVILVQAHDDGRIWEPALGGLEGSSILFEAPKIGLSLRLLRVNHVGPVTQLAVNLRGTTDRSMAVTVIVGRRVSGAGTWWDDGVRGRAFPVPSYSGTGFDFQNLTWAGAGKSGWMSRYPIAVVSSGDRCRSMLLCSPYSFGREMTIGRVGYDANLGLLYAAVDVAVPSQIAVERHRVPDMRNVPDAEIAPTIRVFETARSDWDGFRNRLCELDPERKTWPASQPIGTWMPFAQIGSVQRPEDFGFAFKESGEDAAEDEKHGALSFHYQYATTFWLKMLKRVGRTYHDCVSEFIEAYETPGPGQGVAAARVRLGVCRRSDAMPYCWSVKVPWCDGAVFAVNPLKAIPATYADAFLALLGDGDIKFDEQPGMALSRGQDGYFFDSVDAFGDVVDFNGYWANGPLRPTYDPRTRELGVLNAISAAAYYATAHQWATTLAIRRRFERGLGPILKRTRRPDDEAQIAFTMANGCPTRYWWMAPLFDVMGQEVNWKVDGAWVPMSAEEMWYRRALCGKKPYCLLMNSDFDRWTVEDTRRYFMRCAAYGFFPSFFSHNAYDKNYWEQPAWYNRDRPVFKQFIPVLQTIGRAGWEPVTFGRSDSPREILVERFAAGDAGPQYWTVHNPTDRTVRGRVWLARGRVEGETLREMLSGGEKRGVIDGGELRIDVELRAGETWVLR